jgi:hypothetical protein
MPRSTGVVLWLFGHHDAALLDAELWLEFISNEVATSKITVALTRLDEDVAALSQFRDVIDQRDSRIPLVAADPRDRDSVVEVLHTALRLPHPQKEAVG